MIQKPTAFHFRIYDPLGTEVAVLLLGALLTVIHVFVYFIRFPFVFVDQTTISPARKQPQCSGGVWVTELSLPRAIILQRDRLEIVRVCAERKRWCFEETVTVTLVIYGNKREDVLYKSNIFFLSVNNIDLANNKCVAPVGIILQPFIEKGFPNPNFATGLDLESRVFFLFYCFEGRLSFFFTYQIRGVGASLIRCRAQCEWNWWWTLLDCV